MYTIDQESVRKILINELGYQPGEADLYISDFPPIHDELAEAVKCWMDNRTVKDVSIDDLSISEVMRTRRCHFLMAIRNLNRLMDEDITLEQRKRLIELLRKPSIRW